MIQIEPSAFNLSVLGNIVDTLESTEDLQLIDPVITKNGTSMRIACKFLVNNTRFNVVIVFPIGAPKGWRITVSSFQRYDARRYNVRETVEEYLNTLLRDITWCWSGVPKNQEVTVD